VYGAWAALAFDASPWLLAGVLVLSLAEYAVHRWAFHGAARFAPGLYDLIHGAHHRLPGDPGRRIVPLTHSIPVAVVMYAALGGGPVFSGALLAYLAYEGVHAAAHYRGRLPAPLRYLRRHHARHHHTDDGAAFGVSSPLWDYLLGTMPKAPHPWEVRGAADQPASGRDAL
jgi:sterol desaturase/sphingolipid hydroxylase (fatty acid hydroxylase superfamily)